MGGNGGTGPEAFPTETRVPLRLIIIKSDSNLHQSSSQVKKGKTGHKSGLILTCLCPHHQRLHERPLHL
jgi:hypothetical protein